MMFHRPTVTLEWAETQADRLIWRRLSNSSAYKNAASAADQTQVEEDISRQVWAELEQKYDIEH